MGSVPWGLLEVIAAGCGPIVKLWAPSEPNHALKINEGTPVYSLDFSHNNKVLAVAGEKGQAVLYSSKGAAVATGCLPVGTIPRVPSESVDSITCLKFAPNDSFLLGGCANGVVHIWSLTNEDDYMLDQQHGSITSLAVHPQLTVVATASSSGQVVLSRYPTGHKVRTLLQKGPRAGCLGFASSQPSLLCGAKGSGQVLVWDVNHASQAPMQLNVHKATVTGCTFVPNDDSLLVSCGGDGLLACTDRRTQKVAWESSLRQHLSAVSMRWDGSMVAVGTDCGRVLVHDIRHISTTLAAQEFSDELPVTALCWQYMPPSKSHKRSSTGTAAAVAAASKSASTVAAAGSQSAAPASQKTSAPPKSLTASRGVAATAAATKPAMAAPQRTPLVVPGWDSNTPGSHGMASSSSDVDFGLRVVSPMRVYCSPMESDVNSGPASGGGAVSEVLATAVSTMHTPDVTSAPELTPGGSARTGAGHQGPAMFTPGLAFLGNAGHASSTPLAGPVAGATPVTALPATAASQPTLPQPAAQRQAPAARDNRIAELSQPKPTNVSSMPGTLSVTAAAPKLGPGGSRAKPSSGDAGGVGRSVGPAGDAATATRASADGIADSPVIAPAAASSHLQSNKPCVPNSRGILEDARQKGLHSSGMDPDTGVKPTAVKASTAYSVGGAAPAGGLATTGPALREDVFMAYIEPQMKGLQSAVTNLQDDLQRQFDHAQGNIAEAMSSLAARQDQLAVAICQLTEAVQNLTAHKQQLCAPQSTASVIPWI